jgi:hypothetical protein
MFNTCSTASGAQQHLLIIVDVPAAIPAYCLAYSLCCSDGVSIEWQRQRAKEMRKFFQDRQLESQVKKAQ